MSVPPHLRRLRDYTKIPLEALIAILTFAPVLILIYFYPTLLDRIPVFRNVSGEVVVWSDKSVLSVFRVPLMAIDLQLICLLMKYATVLRAQSALSSVDVTDNANYRERFARLSVGIWDWFRCLIAVKMCAESLDILFISDVGLHLLKTPAWAIAWIGAIVGALGALVYGYRLLAIRREMKKTVGHIAFENPVDRTRVYGRILYYNPSDSAIFIDKYGLNFGNKLSYLFLAGLAAYPLLVFSAS